MKKLSLRQMFAGFIFVLTTSILNVDCAAPQFQGLPQSVNVGEQEYNGRLIYVLTVTDAESFVCTLNPVTETNSDKFRVLIDPITGNYGVYTHNSNPGTAASPNVLFDYAANNSWTVDVDCTDKGNLVNTETLTVNIFDNDRLEFTNLPDTTTPIDALNTASGVQLFTVDAVDLLGHTPLSFSYTTSPATTSFALDTGSGIVTTARALKHEIYSSIDILVTVSDGYMAVRETLRIDLTNLNSVPTITNLPAEVSVLESLASGSVIYTLTVNDDDATDVLSYTTNVNPVTDAGLFTLDPVTLEVKLSTGNTFNYEQATRTYNLTFLVSDTKTETGPYSLVVNILNANEPCYFQNSLYSVAMSEAGIGGYPVDPNFVVNDFDGTSTYTLGLLAGNNSGRFSIDSTSGIINFATVYDVDQNAMPSTVQLTVQCVDPTQLTGTTLLLITIADVNDNDPVFSQGSYSFSVNQNTALGTQLGVLAVTDNDSGTNAEYTCSAIATNNALGLSYYNIGTTDCGVYVLSTTGLTENQIITFAVTATDKGSLARTGTTFVSVTYSTVTTTTTTTTTTTSATTSTTTVDPLTQPGTIAAIIIGSIVGAILLGLLIYFLWRWCYTGACCGPHPCDFTNCCQRPQQQNFPRRQVTPQERHIVKEAPRETADEFKYRRDDTDLGSTKPKHSDYHPRQWRSTGQRDYMDFPQAVTPSDVPLEMSQSRKIIGYTPMINRPAPIGYL